ncbi:hypothetical protein GCM10027168_50480 [Streptomyces capparidis]
MSGSHAGHDHGHTVAGWTGTAVALVGFTVSGAGVVAGWVPGVWLGLGVVALAGLVTWALHLTGWGKPGGPRPRGERPWRVRDPGAARGHAGCVGCRMAGRGRLRPAPAGGGAPGGRLHGSRPGRQVSPGTAP